MRRDALAFVAVALSACSSGAASSPNVEAELVSDPRCREGEAPEDSAGWPERGVLMATVPSGKLRLRDTRAMRRALESFASRPGALAHFDESVREALRCPPAEYAADAYGIRVARYWVSPGEQNGHVRLFQELESHPSGHYSVVADLGLTQQGWRVFSMTGHP